MKLKRTHMCGVLRAEHVGQEVTVSGWVDGIREIGGVVFVVLRDREGIIQLTFDKERDADLLEQAKRLAREYIISARGPVVSRGDRVNPNQATGEVEVEVVEFELLNKAETPPMEVRDDVEFDAELRLKHRYVDLRRPRMQQIFRMRHNFNKAARDTLADEGFLEIETPLLTKPTPEGARDFLVPSRIYPGQFYALPQSPQIFKQILMMSGFDRYMQIARCMRDEDKRGDRQPEHTQLDLEMSFVEPADVQAMVERVAKAVMKACMGIDISLPLPHLSYDEAMQRYGSDKPDTRFTMELVDLSSDMSNSGFGVFKGAVEGGGVVLALRIPGGHGLVSKGQFKNLEKDAKGRGAKGLAFLRYTDNGIDSPIVKFLSAEEQTLIQNRTGAQQGDLVLFVADTRHVASSILAAYRIDFADKLELRDNKTFNYLWVDNFPAFEYDEESNQIIAGHHPFVNPDKEDALIELADELRRTEHKVTPKIVDLALSIKSTQYDFVVNGVELGSGSIRITRPDVQDAMFECLGLSKEDAQRKFGFLLEALKYGAPPMAGIGIGIDRWLMVMQGLDTIQDVIAFPKTAGGKGLMDECPAMADPALLEELRLQVKDE